jgi:tRNA-dihydrouridine synthase B
MKLSPLLPSHRPLLILAPMQDVTDLAFWKIIHHYGDPDLYYTEYFRVHADSKPEGHILRSIIENPTGKPVIAQMIGQDIPSLIRTAQSLQEQKIIGVDLNLGCPASIVCRKNVGGGLLRNPWEIEQILTALRPAIGMAFTVKTRIGYDTPEEFDRLIPIYARHPIDALTVHGRTVRELYQPKVHYDRINQARQAIPCPVFANGNVLNVSMAHSTVGTTGAAGLMIGRGAIRNPWIFRQIRESYEGGVQTRPTLQDVREYIELLYKETTSSNVPERSRVSKMKKYMNFIAPGIGGDDAFVTQIRRCATGLEFFQICDRYLLNDNLLDSDPFPTLKNSNSPAISPGQETSTGKAA